MLLSFLVLLFIVAGPHFCWIEFIHDWTCLRIVRLVTNQSQTVLRLAEYNVTTSKTRDTTVWVLMTQSGLLCLTCHEDPKLKEGLADEIKVWSIVAFRKLVQYHWSRAFNSYFQFLGLSDLRMTFKRLFIFIILQENICCGKKKIELNKLEISSRLYNFYHSITKVVFKSIFFKCVRIDFSGWPSNLLTPPLTSNHNTLLFVPMANGLLIMTISVPWASLHCWTY